MQEWEAHFEGMQGVRGLQHKVHVIERQWHLQLC